MSYARRMKQRTSDRCEEVRRLQDKGDAMNRHDGWSAKARTWLAERLSIRQRLTFWYAGVLTLILIALSVITYTVAENQIQSSLNNDIRTRAISIAAALQHDEYTSTGGSTVLQPSPTTTTSPATATPDPTASAPSATPGSATPSSGPAPTIGPTPVTTPDPATNSAIQRQINVSVPDALGHLDIGFEVLDTQGRLKYLAPALNGHSLPINYAIVDGALHGVSGSYSAQSDGTSYAIYAQPIILDARAMDHNSSILTTPRSTTAPTGATPSGANQEVIGVVLVAKSQDDVNAALNTLLRILLIGGLLAVICAMLGGWLIAESGLRPIASVTHAAGAIANNAGGADLNARVAYHGAKDEVGELVSTFNNMLSAVQTAAEAQRRFVADASHELRTPLTTIRVNLQMLRNAHDLPEQDRDELVDDAYLEAERMTSLVTDLLLLARVDAAGGRNGRGEAELHEQLTGRREPVEIDQLVMELLRAGLTQLRASHKSIRLTVSTLAPVIVMADPGQLRQLGRILIDNAIKYTPDGGQITLGVTQTGPLVSISVSDTGIGIEPEDLPHIYERFYRSDEARERDEHGSGLGLAIARWIAEAHQGEIKVESTPGKGSVFTVVLPVARRQLLEQSQPRTPAIHRKRQRQPAITPLSLPAIRPLARLAQSVTHPPTAAERADARRAASNSAQRSNKGAKGTSGPSKPHAKGKR
jgi:signal transduction histidine kinase